MRLRAHLLLLLADGHARAVVCAVLFCSTATVARWKSRFEAGGVDREGAVPGEGRGRLGVLLGWADLVVLWVKDLSRGTSGTSGAGGAAPPWRWCCGPPTG